MPAMMTTATALPIAGLEFQLEEMEDKDSAATSVIMEKDGSLSFGETSGPIPITSTGRWEMKGDEIFMVVTREYEGAFSYSVTREFHGSVEQVFEATKTVFLSGDIKMDDANVGYFKMISAPGDLESNEKIREEHVV